MHDILLHNAKFIFVLRKHVHISIIGSFRVKR
jgi:hypothetical protein